MNSAKSPARKRRAVAILICGAVLLVGIVFLALQIRPTPPPNQFSWLTPAELACAKTIGPLTRMKFQVMRWTAPFWKRYWQRRPQISIQATILRLTPTTPWPTNLSPPFATTTNGTRVWILSPEALDHVQTQVAALPEAAVLARPRITTPDGNAAQMSVGNSVSVGTKTVSTGLNLYLIPATAGDKIAITLGLDHTELEPNSSGAPGIRTNQSYACRSVFPNCGGLLVENPTPEPNALNRFWLLFQAQAVDANGRPLGR